MRGRLLDKLSWLAVPAAIGLAVYGTYLGLDEDEGRRLPGLTGSLAWHYEDEKSAPDARIVSVYYGLRPDRELIFQGIGGEEPEVTMVGDTLLIRYCGGRQLFAEPRFQDFPTGMPPESLRWITLKVATQSQSVGGAQVVCGGKPSAPGSGYRAGTTG